ncbi:hypothetical protein I316_00977 [Kwoniella heveanensis BCC8398]|uniref:Uncharacterized protein n=1 Tax=Kwoniella heveanensis BCC8398 TaxID=1296120 RepID=A0A1B9H1C3_9TREE|nr:hypothetical protein I316_00977 [Kwoniella heveanensis BCC8398]
MSNRSTTRHRTPHNTIPTPPLQRTTSRPGSSRPTTPSYRGDIPSRKSSTNHNLAQASTQSSQQQPEYPHMTEQPTTPIPRKTRRTRKGAKSSDQRYDDTFVADEPVDRSNDISTEDEETLFDILGVSSPAPAPTNSEAENGMLRLSSDDMNLALGKGTRQTGRKGRKNIDSQANTDSDTGRAPRRAQAEGSPLPKKREARGKFRIAATGNEGEEKGASDGDMPREQRKGKKGSKQASPLVDGDATDGLNLGAEKGLPAKPKISGLSASRPSHAPKKAQPAQSLAPEADLDAFETASLSQSLPSGGLAGPLNNKNRRSKGKKNGGSGDESAVWEMPEVAGGQELTWQQKLQASANPNDSPRRNNRATNTEKKSKKQSTATAIQPHPAPSTHALPAVPSPFNPRPVHARRASADTIPTSAPVNRSVPISAFDYHIPFHTGFNVHRAPQTPAKGVAAANGNMSNGILPIVGSGQFPRLQGGLGASEVGGPSGGDRRGSGNVPGLGPKYAGPTFHNSPAAASLSKPDLEDF